MSALKQYKWFSMFAIIIGPLIGLFVIMIFVLDVFSIFNGIGGASKFNWYKLPVFIPFSYILGVPAMLVILFSMYFELKIRSKNSYFSVLSISFFVPSIVVLVLLIFFERASVNFPYGLEIGFIFFGVPSFFASAICWYLSGLVSK